MNITIPISQNDLTRQERLFLWIWKSPYSQAEIARQVGVTPCTFGKWMRAERLPVRCVTQMRAFGIPEDLLPRAEDIPPGNRAGWKLHNETIATS